MDPLLSFLRTAYRLKDEERSGWVLRGIRRPESVGDHSCETAPLCMLYASEEGVDEAKALRIALVHDLAEAEIGDIPTRADPEAPRVDPDQKAQAEHNAMEELLFPVRDRPVGDRIHRLWKDYEARGSREARFVRDMNLVDMCIQAFIYESDQRYSEETGAENFPSYSRLDEFFATSEPRLQTATGKRLFGIARQAYQSLSSD